MVVPIVLQLALPYLGKGHHIFDDRFYSSLRLIQTLAVQHTHSTGTVVKNRVDLPDPICVQFSLPGDEMMQFRCRRLMVIAWRAKGKKQPVIMVSLACSAGMTEVQNRRGDTVKKTVATDKYIDEQSRLL